ncbi:MAG: hypothetical protein K2H85_09565 [Allobaculum sp.]|nr:hypothetical protein [Allobaculum sp.]
MRSNLNNEPLIYSEQLDKGVKIIDNACLYILREGGFITHRGHVKIHTNFRNKKKAYFYINNKIRRVCAPESGKMYGDLLWLSGRHDILALDLFKENFRQRIREAEEMKKKYESMLNNLKWVEKGGV